MQYDLCIIRCGEVAYIVRIQADSDESALARAAQEDPGEVRELYCGPRFVKRLDALESAEDDSQIQRRG